MLDRNERKKKKNEKEKFQRKTFCITVGIFVESLIKLCLNIIYDLMQQSDASGCKCRSFILTTFN